MPSYALLIAPSANRVYADSAIRLTAAELTAFGPVLSAKPGDVRELRLGGVPYIAFDFPAPGLTERDLSYISNLSSVYALFGLEDGGLLRPAELTPLAFFDEDLLTIQKYSGKTNEQFTKLLLNVTLLASSHAENMLTKQLTVLDPLCGRGTTLNQALMYGYDAIGIDTDGKDFDIYSAFIRTWLKRKRIKHKAEITPVRKEKKTLARRMNIAIGPYNKHSCTLMTFHADSIQAREYMKGGVADVIVADLPYGVTHGSRTAGEGLSRSPQRLLEQAVPVWSNLVQPGGAIGISWNTHVATRAEAIAVFEAAGLRIATGPGYDDLEHWVDQSITRDVLVARKI